MSELPEETIGRLQARVADLEAELEALRDEHRVAREHDRLRHQEHALGLVIEAEAARDKYRLVTKRLNRVKERAESQQRDSRRRVRELEDMLAAIRESRSWRIGRAVTRPGRVGRRP